MKLSRLKSERPRREHDFYPTPYGLAKEALRRFSVDESMPEEWFSVLDAGCGEGIWMRASEEVFTNTHLSVYGVDLEPKCRATTADFLGAPSSYLDYEYVHLVFGNPPYSLMEEFITHSLKSSILYPGGYVFFLGRLEFLASKKRGLGLFKEYPPKRVYVLSRRPSFFSTNGRKTTDAQDYAMYLWKDGWKGDTKLDWLYWEYDEEQD